MYFDLTDEQQAIRATAHDFLASRFKSERIREIAASEDGFDASGWQEMAELGWAGLALPEEWGGQGLGAVELAVLFEEMGYALAPSPLLSNTIAGLALATGGSDEQKERWLRPLAEGTLRGTPALIDAGGPAEPMKFSMSAGDGLTGEKTLVLDAASADTSSRRGPTA
jgi:alkylation response protein AidB-like acyl-CoA dehydrogenase